MALVKCAECGKEVSSSVQTCIHCGRSLKAKSLIDADVTLPGIMIVAGLLATFLAPQFLMPFSIGLAVVGAIILVVRLLVFKASN